MMSFITTLLRFFVAVAIALFVIFGGVAGWFYDALPTLTGAVDVSAVPAASLATRILGVVAGAIAGLVLATFTFGVLALLLDIHDRLGRIIDTLAGEAAVPGDGRPLNYQR